MSTYTKTCPAGLHKMAAWANLCAKCRDTAEAARLEALPEVDYDGGPVAVVHLPFNLTLYESLAEALDAQDDEDLASLVIHPCDVRPADLPPVSKLADLIYDYIHDQVPDVEWWVSDAARELLEQALAALDPTPDVWSPMVQVRLKRTWLEART
jgi:hypothetical protein